MALPQVCPVATGSGRGEGGGVLQSYGPGQESPVACGCCWCSPPGLAHSCSHPLAHTHTPRPSSSAPRACSPGLPLSQRAHSCACLLPSPGALGPPAGEWIFPASVNKWWQRARWAGDRRGQHCSQGVPSTEAQPGGEMGRHPERERETFRCRQTDPRKPCWAPIEVETGGRK